MAGCEGCVWYVRTHYNGTPDDEIYDECECHYMVLHEDELIAGCDQWSSDPATREEE